MKEIPLYGKYSHLSAIVDDEDWEWLSQYKWHGTNCCNHLYARTSLGSRKFLMHRLILGLQPGDNTQTDHIDHDGLHNRRENLRKCNHAQNQANRLHTDIGISGFRGVRLHNGGPYYGARMVVYDVEISRGEYRTPEDAARARNAMALKYFGSFAEHSLNIIPGMSYQEMITDPGPVTKTRSCCTSAYRGVSWRPTDNAFVVQIGFQGIPRRLKQFPPAQEQLAALYYDAAAVLLHGDKARLNFPREQSAHLLPEVADLLQQKGAILTASVRLAPATACAEAADAKPPLATATA